MTGLRSTDLVRSFPEKNRSFKWKVSEMIVCYYICISVAYIYTQYYVTFWESSYAEKNKSQNLVECFRRVVKVRHLYRTLISSNSRALATSL